MSITSPIAILLPFDEAAYHAQQQAELFESITRSFVTMEEYNQQSARAAHNFFLNQARNQMSTAASIDMSNRGILAQYDMTMEELYNNADSLKEIDIALNKWIFNLNGVYVTLRSVGCV